jgi:hypothetical protein
MSKLLKIKFVHSDVKMVENTENNKKILDLFINIFIFTEQPRVVFYSSNENASFV